MLVNVNIHSDSSKPTSQYFSFFGTCDTTEILEMDIRNGQIAGILVTQSLITLTVALGQLNSPVHIMDRHCIVGYIPYAALATAALEAGF